MSEKTQGSKLILDGSAHSDLKSDSETLGWLGYVCLSSFGPPVALWRAVITCKSVSVPDQGKVYCQGLYGQYTSPWCCQPVSLITSPLHPPHWWLPSTWTSAVWRESLTLRVWELNVYTSENQGEVTGTLNFSSLLCQVRRNRIQFQCVSLYVNANEEQTGYSSWADTSQPVNFSCKHFDGQQCKKMRSILVSVNMSSQFNLSVYHSAHD